MDHSKQSLNHSSIHSIHTIHKKKTVSRSILRSIDRSTKARVLLRTYPLNVAVARVGMDCAVSIFLLGACVIYLTRSVLLCRPSVRRPRTIITHRIPNRFHSFMHACMHSFVRSFRPTDRRSQNDESRPAHTQRTPHKGVARTKFQSDDPTTNPTTDPTSHESINHPHTRPRKIRHTDGSRAIASVRRVRESRVVKVSQRA